MKEKNPWVLPSLILGIAIITAVLLYKLLPGRTSVVTSPFPATSSVSFPSDLPVIQYTEAPNYIGKEAIVEGTVVRMGSSQRGTIFLNFCFDYRKCPFYAVIFASQASNFPHPQQYQGKKVQIWGVIGTYRNQAQIILNDPSQIRVVE